MARRDLDRMQDILEAIAAVRRHQPATFAEFESDEVIRTFSLKEVEIIGEAAFKTSAALKSSHPEVPWSAIEKTRHIFVHDYFAIEWDKLWSVITDHLEPLREQVERIAAELSCEIDGDAAHE
jgi:uncharacterized protein with HEPN domain